MDLAALEKQVFQAVSGVPRLVRRSPKSKGQKSMHIFGSKALIERKRVFDCLEQGIRICAGSRDREFLKGSPLAPFQGRRRRSAGNAVIDGRGQAIDIGPGSEIAIEILLGRRKAVGQGLEGSKPVVVIDRLGRAEIQQQGLATGPKQDVGGLDVKMHDAVLVHAPESVSDGGKDLLHEIPVEIPHQFVDEPAQVAAFFVWHDHVQRLVCLEVLGHADDVWMADGAHPLRFEAELFQAVAKRHLGKRRVRLKGPIGVARDEVLGAVLLDDEFVAFEFVARKVHQTEPAPAKDFAHGISLEHVSVL